MEKIVFNLLGSSSLLSHSAYILMVKTRILDKKPVNTQDFGHIWIIR